MTDGAGIVADLAGEVGDARGDVDPAAVALDGAGRLHPALPLAGCRPLAEVLHELGIPDGGRRSAERAIRIVLRLCEAMGHAHGRGVGHGHLDLSSIAVGADDEVFVTGWERALRIEAPPATAGGDPRQDVHAIGAILRSAFEAGPPADDPDPAASSSTGPPGSGTDAALARICARATHRDPADRYADTAALAAALRGYLGAIRTRTLRRATTVMVMGATAVVGSIVALALAADGWFLSYLLEGNVDAFLQMPEIVRDWITAPPGTFADQDLGTWAVLGALVGALVGWVAGQLVGGLAGKMPGSRDRDLLLVANALALVVLIAGLRVWIVPGGAHEAKLEKARAAAALPPVEVPGGIVILGRSRKSEVHLSTFWMDPTEVTVEAYGACVSAGLCRPPATALECYGSSAGEALLPVNCVSAEQASEYCAWVGGRLPTWAEWERAIRGELPEGFLQRTGWMGRRPTVSSGGSMNDVRPVGTTTSDSSPEGILDLAQNAAEWVTVDGYDRGPALAVPDPVDEDGAATRGLVGHDRGDPLGDADVHRGNAAPTRTGFRCVGGPGYTGRTVVPELRLDPAGATLLAAAFERLAARSPDAALSSVDRALEAAPGHPFALHRRATLLRDADVGGALAALDEALAILEHAPARRLRAHLLAETGRSSEALADLDALVAMAPNRGWTFVRRGDLKASTGDPEGAAEDYLAAARLRVTPVALVRRTGVLADADAVAAERLASAALAAEVHDWLRSRPDSSETVEALRSLASSPAAPAWVHVALATRLTKVRGRRLDAETRGAALAELARALELEPGHAEALRVRASIRQLEGDHAAAMRDLTASIESTPSAEALSARADLHAHFGDLPAGLADLDDAIALSPAETYHRRRAAIHLALGHRTAAALDQRRARELQSKFP